MFYFDNSLTLQIDLLAKARYRLGQYIIDPATGRGYRYYHNAGADSTVVGDVAAHKGTFGQISVTSGDGVINAVSTVARAAGVAQAVVPTGYCGWFQTKGAGTAAIAVTDGNVAAGDPLVVDGGGTPIGAVDTMADGEEESVFGYALAADSGTTQPAETYILTID